MVLDLDECAVLQTSTVRICNTGKCNNTFGSFTCECPSNYEGDFCEVSDQL